MLLISTNDFEFGAYVPNRDDAPNSDIIGNEPILEGFIEEYVTNCLVETLGWDLWFELNAQLVDGALPPGADQKWLDLVNGKDNYKGMLKGMLVGYVYFYWLQNDIIDYSTTGTQRDTSDNANNVRPDSKMITQYGKFFDQAIGRYGAGPTIIQKDGGRTGIIWGAHYGSNWKSMYEFLRENYEETYPDWKPNLFINQVNYYDI
jgi:hypothetical protein